MPYPDKIFCVCWPGMHRLENLYIWRAGKLLFVSAFDISIQNRAEKILIKLFHSQKRGNLNSGYYDRPMGHIRKMYVEWTGDLVTV